MARAMPTAMTKARAVLKDSLALSIFVVAIV
jgi:hypothetical protein